MKIALSGGNYQSRSIIASCQRVLNLYPEMIAQNEQEPFPVVYLQTPGLRHIVTSPTNDPIRCLYKASNGDLYVVSGIHVYFVDKNFAFFLLGSFANNSNKPVIMTDNGVNLFMCDGTSKTGFISVLATHNGFAPISAEGWFGSTYLDYTDTFIIANFIGTPSFYISGSDSTTFDPLDFAAKSAKPDVLVAAVVSHRVLWLIGSMATEIWYNTGGGGLGTGTNNFPFEIMPGISIEDGCCAPYSIAKADTMIFWLAQNQNGTRFLILGSGDKTQRISNHAIENEWASYSRVDDAIAYCYMQNGHPFYVLNFPTADKTWVYDLSSKLWHERAWIDTDGVEHRHRASYHAFAYDLNVVGDWENGNLYMFDQNFYTDNGSPIKRVRSFPQQIDQTNNSRVFFRSFIADMQTGTNLDPADPSTVSLRWSNDRGNSWQNPLEQSVGRTGEYNTNIQWNRLGYSRDRVYELFWSLNAKTALNGAFIDTGIGKS